MLNNGKNVPLNQPEKSKHVLVDLGTAWDQFNEVTTMMKNYKRENQKLEKASK